LWFCMGFTILNLYLIWFFLLSFGQVAAISRIFVQVSLVEI
jgi:hypothetical protein